MHKDATISQGSQTTLTLVFYMLSECRITIQLPGLEKKTPQRPDCWSTNIKNCHSPHTTNSAILWETSLTWPKLWHDIWTAPCCSHSRLFTHRVIPTDDCAITEICKMWHFHLNHDEALAYLFLKLPTRAKGTLAFIIALINTVLKKQSDYLTRRWILRQRHWVWVRRWRSQSGKPR